MPRPSPRRLLLLAAAFALSFLSCGREITGPNGGSLPRVAAIGLDPHLPSLFSQLQNASALVPFERVRVVLRRTDGSVSIDTLVNFPAGADSVSLTLLVPIPLNAPEAGLPLTLTMAYINAAGDTVFRGGPTNLVAAPAGSPGAGVPVTVPVTYDGPGRNATRIVITPDTGTVTAGSSSSFAAQAFDAQGNVLAGTPILFYTLDSARAVVPNVGSGQVNWLPDRGIARIVAAHPNGQPSDTATFTVVLPASRIELASGNNQSAEFGSTLAQPIAVRVTAADSVPVAGVVVNFAIASGGGTLLASADTTDAAGLASVPWRLGVPLGPQTATASVAGLTGSPVTFTATAVPGAPRQLAVVAQPTAGTAGAVLAPPLVVAVQDSAGNTVTSSTASVTVALDASANATLGGTTTRAAVNGLATFDNLTIERAASFVLHATSDSLVAAATAPIAIAAAAATRLEFVAQPLDAVAGATLTPAVGVRARDAFGNTATGFTGDVTAALAVADAGTLGGTVTVPAVSGVATFTDLSLRRAGGGRRLAASAAGLLPDTSAAFAISAGTVDSLVLVSGGGQTAVSGTALAAPVVVAVRDAFGNAVAGAAVTFSTTSGTVTPNATADSLGQASANWTLGSGVGLRTLTVAIAGVPTLTLAVTATAIVGPAATIARATPSGDAQVGAPGALLGDSLRARVTDAVGNPVTGAAVAWSGVGLSVSADTVLTDSLGLAAVRATLGTVPGPATATARLVDLPDSSVSFTATIETTEIAYVDMVAQPTNGTAGAPLAAFSAAAFDQFANVVTSFTGTVTVTAERTNGTPVPVFGGDTVQAVGGVATIDDLRVHAAGNVRFIIDFGPDIGTIVTTTVAITAGAADSLVAVSGGGQSGLTSTVLADSLVVRVADAFGNPVGGVEVIWGSRQGLATPSTETTQTDAVGRTAIAVSLLDVAGTDTIIASAGSLTGSPAEFVVTVLSADVAYLTVDVQPIDAVAGDTLEGIVITARDSTGNRVATFTGTVTAAIVDGPAGGVLFGTATLAADTGVVYFETLSLRTAGTYRLRFFTAGAADTVSQAFSISPAAPSVFTRLGDLSRDLEVGETLAEPLRVQLQDGFENGIAGRWIRWEVTSGGGALAVDSSLTDAQGIAAALFTAPTLVGSTAIVASPLPSIAGLDPLGFTVVATPGAATSLVLAAQPNSAVAGEDAEDFRLEARDQYGNVAAGFTGTVTGVVLDGPASTFYGGPFGADSTLITVDAVAGIATFTGVQFREAGSYQLQFTHGGFDAVPTAFFDVVAGAPTVFEIVSGDGQTVPAGEAVPDPLVVRLLDAFGNPVDGDSVVFTVTTGGGLLGQGSVADTSLTDALGRASVTWTVGLALGEQTVTATSRIAPPLVFTATVEEQEANITWTGAVSSAWDDPLNWIGGVPTPTDSVRIEPGTHQPVLADDVTIARLTVAPGAALALQSHRLFVSGLVTLPTTYGAIATGIEGALYVTGTGSYTLTGHFPTTHLRNGTYQFSASSLIDGSLYVQDGALLSVTGAQALEVSGDFGTFDGGRLAMGGGAPQLIVTGNAEFSGGSTAGLLSGGTLRVAGSFIVDGPEATAFSPAAGHATELNGEGVSQLVQLTFPDTSLTTACAASCFGQLFSSKATGSVVFGTSVKAVGGINIVGPEVSAGGQSLISTGTPVLSGPTVTAARVAWQTGLVRPAAFFVDTLVAWGTLGDPLILSENVPTVVAGTHRISGLHNAGVFIEGTLAVDGPGAEIAGELRTRGSGQLVMNDASDTLRVSGDVVFAGEVGAVGLSQGLLEIGGDLRQLGAGRTSVLSVGTHTVRFASTTPVLAFDAHDENALGTLRVAVGTGLYIDGPGVRLLGDVIIEGEEAGVAGAPGGLVILEQGTVVDSLGGRWGYPLTRFDAPQTTLPSVIDGSVIFANVVTLQADLETTGSVEVAGGFAVLTLDGRRLDTQGFATSAGGRLVMADAADTLVAAGNVTFAGGASTLSAGYLEVHGDFTQAGSPTAFQAEPEHATWFAGDPASAVSFATPGFGPTGSHFGELYLSKEVGAPTTLSTDVFVNGMLETGGQQPFRLTGTGQRLVSRGADVYRLQFENVRWELVDGAPVERLDTLRFESMDPTATFLRIARAGGTVTLNEPVFVAGVTAPGAYLEVEDTAADASTLTVVVVEPSPPLHGGFARTLGGAVIQGWDAFGFFSWTGTESDDWHDPANWAQGFVPGAGDSVIVGAAPFAPRISQPTTLRSLGNYAATPITIEANLTITGWLTLSDATDGITCASGPVVILTPADSAPVQGRIDCEFQMLAGRTLLSGNAWFGGDVYIAGDARLEVGGFLGEVAGAFSTVDDGTLVMQDGGGTFLVQGIATFGGGASGGLLTAGQLLLYGDFRQVDNATAFQANPPHRTQLLGGPLKEVSFANPSADASGSFFGNLRIGMGGESVVRLLTDVFANGALDVGDGEGRHFASSLPGGVTLQSRGALGTWGLQFENVRWRVFPGAELSEILENVRFFSMAEDVTQLEIQRTSGSITLDGFVFDSTAVDATFLAVADPNGATDGLFSVAMVNPLPTFHGGRIATDGFATILDWAAEPGFIWIGGTSDWNDPGNWADGIVPTPASSVEIPPGFTAAPLIPENTELTDLVITATGAIPTEGDVIVRRNYSAPIPGTDGLHCAAGASLVVGIGLYPENDVRGRIACLFNAASGDVRLTGDLDADSAVVSGTAVLHLDGHTFVAGHTFRTEGGGALVMAQSTDSLHIGSDATFAGGESVLSAGAVYIGGSFYQAGVGTAYDATTGHRTILGDYCGGDCGDQPGSFENPTMSGFGTLIVADRRTFTSNVEIRADLTFTEAGRMRSSGRTIDVYGSLSGDDATWLEALVLRVAGGLEFTGLFEVDTTIFNGPTQRIPMGLNYRTLVVTGTADAYTDNLDLRMNVSGDLRVRDSGLLRFGAPGDFAAVDVEGNLITQGSGVIQMTQDQVTVTVFGDAIFAGGATTGLLTNGTLELYGSFLQLGDDVARFAAAGNHVTLLRAGIDQSVTMTGAGVGPNASSFGILVVGQTAAEARVLLGSNIWITGALATLPAGHSARIEREGVGIAARINSGGTELATGILFDNVIWHIGDAASIDAVLPGLEFDNVESSEAQLRIERSGTSVLLQSPSFFAGPSATGPFLVASGAGLTVDVDQPTPNFHGGRIAELDGAQITGWPEEPGFVWTGAVSADWTNPGNWSDALVPNATSVVTIPPDATVNPSIGAPTTVRQLINQSPTAVVELIETELIVTERLALHPDGDGFSCPFSDAVVVQPATTAQVEGRMTGCSLVLSGGPVVPTGRLEVWGGGLVVTDGASLTLAADTVLVQGFTTSEGGVLAMQSADALLDIYGPAVFGGGSTVDLLTAGRIIARDDFTQQGTPDAFHASGGHVTQFDNTEGFSALSIAFENPDQSQFANVLYVERARELQSEVRIAGTLELLASAPLQGNDRVTVTDLVGADTTVLQVRAVDVLGSFAYAGTLFVDTVYFSAGAPTQIPAVVGATVVGWRSIVVRGIASVDMAGLDTLSLTGGLIVEGDGELTVGDPGVPVRISANSLRVLGNGLLILEHPDAVIYSRASVVMAGRASTGRLTSGEIVASHSMTVGADAAYDAGPGHVLRLTQCFPISCDGTPTLTLTDSTSRLGSVVVAHPWTVTSAPDRPLRLSGDLAVSTLFASPDAPLRVEGSYLAGESATITTPRLDLGAAFGVEGTFSVDTLVVLGTAELPAVTPIGASDVEYRHVIVRGSATLGGGDDTVRVANSLTVDGGTLGLGSGPAGLAIVGADFRTENGGTLVMNQSGDYLRVNGTATFAGGSTEGLLVAGTLDLRGYFTQDGGDERAFAAEALHVTHFERSGENAVFFANPGATLSRFQNLSLRYPGEGWLELHSDVFATGRLLTTPGYSSTIQAPIGDSYALHSAGADVDNLVFTRVRWDLSGVAPVSALSNVAFYDQDPTAVQWRIARPSGSQAVTSPTFGTEPTTGLYLVAEDIDGAADFIVTVTSPTPLFHAGRIAEVNGATIQGWEEEGEFLWLGTVDSDFYEEDNWDRGVVPGVSDRIVLDGNELNNLVIGSPVTIGALRMTGSGAMTVSEPLTVRGDFDAPAGNVSCIGNHAILIAPPVSATFNSVIPACDIAFTSGTARISNDAVVGNALVLGSARLEIRDLTLQVYENLSVSGDGTLVMDEADGVVTVFGDAVFDGATSLTAGTLHVYNNFVAGTTSATAFVASGTHRTLIGDSTAASPARDISFVPATASSYFNDLRILDGQNAVTLGLYVRGELALENGAVLFGDAVDVVGSVRTTSDANIQPTRFSLQGTMDQVLGTFQPDTADFRGLVAAGSQQIPAATASPVPYHVIRVFGDAQMADTQNAYAIGGELFVLGDGRLRIAPLSGSDSVLVNAYTPEPASLTVQGAGARLVMDGPGRLGVRDALFDGASTLGTLTEGRLVVRGDFTQANTYSAQSFAATDDHLLEFVGDGVSAIDFASPDSLTGSRVAHFAIADIEKSLAVSSDVMVETVSGFTGLFVDLAAGRSFVVRTAFAQAETMAQFRMYAFSQVLVDAGGCSTQDSPDIRIPYDNETFVPEVGERGSVSPIGCFRLVVP